MLDTRINETVLHREPAHCNHTSPLITTLKNWGQKWRIAFRWMWFNKYDVSGRFSVLSLFPLGRGVAPVCLFSLVVTSFTRDELAEQKKKLIFFPQQRQIKTAVYIFLTREALLNNSWLISMRSQFDIPPSKRGDHSSGLVCITRLTCMAGQRELTLFPKTETWTRTSLNPLLTQSFRM